MEYKKWNRLRLRDAFFLCHIIFYVQGGVASLYLVSVRLWYLHGRPYTPDGVVNRHDFVIESEQSGARSFAVLVDFRLDFGGRHIRHRHFLALAVVVVEIQCGMTTSSQYIHENVRL